MADVPVDDAREDLESAPTVPPPAITSLRGVMLVAAALLAIAIASAAWIVRSGPLRPKLAESEPLPGMPAAPSGAGTRIAAGRTKQIVEEESKVWSADRYFTGGAVKEVATDTATPEIYRSERFGNFTYSIPVAQDGVYELTLHFYEADGEGNRVFNVYANNQALLSHFDLFRAAGGSNRTYKRTFHGIRPDAQGKIHLSFEPIVNDACVNAIEIEDESPPPRPAPK